MTAFAVPGLRTVVANGVNLAYVERGAGAPSVVFVHGGYSDLRTWLQQLDAFAKEHRVVAYSRRYARPNEDIPTGHDDQMGPHVDDLLSLIQSLDLAPAHLVGNSWGAFICLLAALKEPGLVRTLVLGEPPVLPLFISNSPKLRELLAVFLRGPRDAISIMRFGAQVVGPAERAYRAGELDRGTRIFVTGVLGSRAFDGLPEERKRQMRENHTADAAQLLGAGFPPLRDSDVRQIQTPTLLVTGERSPTVLRRTLTRRLEHLLPNVERVEIPGASHLMHEENPEGFNRAVLPFLQRHKG
ncbi:MAG: alpha/beta hydrolase [Armatimonadota bacterium]|nr:alpha/beta hydrolase [Armatimonadota bacterium]